MELEVALSESKARRLNPFLGPSANPFAAAPSPFGVSRAEEAAGGSEGEVLAADADDCEHSSGPPEAGNSDSSKPVPAGARDGKGGTISPVPEVPEEEVDFAGDNTGGTSP